jgi:hypothetical protein
VRWRRQRLPLLPFVGVAALVSLAAHTLTVSSTLVAFVVLGALRLQDDVRSADVDARRHPDRAVVQGPRALYARAAVVACLLAMVVATLVGHAGVIGVFVFIAVVSLAPLPAALVTLLVLLKYPLLAWTLAEGPVSGGRLLLLGCAFVIDETVTGEVPLPARSLVFVVAALLLAFVVTLASSA